MITEETIDALLDNFDYVRVIGRGGSNHIGIELTVSCPDKKVDDTESREAIKTFLWAALNVQTRSTQTKTSLVNALNVLELLPRRLPDETPLADALPGMWPTLGDLRKLVKEANLEREN